jgi:PAS domain S-box-containing protein
MSADSVHPLAAAPFGSDERFTTIADAAPILIWMSGPDGGCTYFNRRWLDFTGRSLEQELGDGWVESVHPDDARRCVEDYRAALAVREPFQLRYRLRRHDGDYRTIVDAGVPWTEGTDRFLGYIGSCVDVTDAEDAARRHRAFLRQILDVTPNFIFVIDKDGRFALVNQAFADAYGTTVDEMIGRTHADLNHDTSAVERSRRIDLEVLRTGEERFVSEERLTDVRGRVRYLQTVKRPILGEDGVAEQIFCSSTDITRRREAELELRRLHDELAHMARLSTMGELAASLAHELNQPLAAIMANAQAAERSLGAHQLDVDDIREILADIVGESRRAADIIQRTRALVRREAHSFSPIELEPLIRDVLPLVHGGVVLHDVRLRIEIEPDLPRVEGDRVQLQQVVLNLLLNAIDSMEGSPRGLREVTVSARRTEGGTVTVSVSDRGTGLSATVLDQMFQPFYTTKQGGLGMGLSISRSIIAVHHGRLRAANNSDAGATVSFVLPAIEWDQGLMTERGASAVESTRRGRHGS